MKHIILILTLIPFLGMSQATTTITLNGFDAKSYEYNSGSYGFNPTKETDTIPAIALVTFEENCEYKTIDTFVTGIGKAGEVNGFAVRRKHSYSGDRMPINGSQSMYADYWEVEKILNEKKKPFSECITVWQWKLKPTSKK